MGGLQRSGFSDETRRMRTSMGLWGIEEYNFGRTNSKSMAQTHGRNYVTEIIRNSCSVAKSSPTLCDSMDCSPPGSSVQGILQARILEWVAIPSPGDLPNAGIESGLLHCWWVLYDCTAWEAHIQSQPFVFFVFK